MIRDGRSRHTVGIFFVCIFSIFQQASTEYGIPIEIKLWDSKRNPLSHMVDVTNEFGLKILAEHNFLNDNNIAFSPYGLMGILVALYEGVDGECSYQIQRSMQLPWNRNVMRIGFRDIHRTLKTYFVPEEGFLAGLALNNDNVTFTESYKKILRFYGFDLDQPNTNNTTEKVTTPLPNNINTETNTSTTLELINDVATTTLEPTKEETTLNPSAETIDIRGGNPETTSMTPVSTESEPQLITSTKSNNVDLLVVKIPTASDISDGTELNTETTSQTSNPTVTSIVTESSTMPSTTDSSTITPEITIGTVEDTVTTQVVASTSDVTMEVATTSTLATTSTTTDTLTTLTTEGTSTMSESLPTEETSNVDETTVTSTTPSTSTLETLERRKKSIFDYILTNPPYIDYPMFRSFDVGIELSPEHNNEDKMFLVNGLRNIQVSYMRYDSIMDHAYLPHLEASALRLPLDSDRYYLLVVLPMRRGEGEIARLLARMARESDLSDVYAALQPRRVKAMVPSFTVKGHISITTDLQKLGVRDVFEPRQNDFTPMTHLPGVYVRSIEQAVSVVIRKYQPDSLKNRYITNRNPVVFSATYPFLYFVMDTTINVALMAGKMVDPLNTRIL